MTCSYCGSHNGETDHRCRRCGRRPEDILNKDVAMHRTSGALATKLQPVVMPERPPVARLAVTPNLAGAVQGNLFTPNVVAMPARAANTAKSSATRTTKAAKTQQKRAPRVPEAQGQLEFLAPEQPKPRTLGTTVEAMIYCEAPVASPMHRALAAAVDWAMVLIAYGVFLLTYSLMGGEFVFTKTSLMIFAGTFALVAAAYGLYWTAMGTDSAGMRWMHLRVITFNGFPPEPSQRALRLFGSCLSLFSVLGLFWAMADEEGLGWQDHMSRTFPTPHELESRVFQRR